VRFVPAWSTTTTVPMSTGSSMESRRWVKTSGEA
jgi:hypothetical protein